MAAPTKVKVQVWYISPLNQIASYSIFSEALEAERFFQEQEVLSLLWRGYRTKVEVEQIIAAVGLRPILAA